MLMGWEAVPLCFVIVSAHRCDGQVLLHPRCPRSTVTVIIKQLW
uniref:Uncharacterized protein n=1 Tax=Anguilla anguilla TaxID=7936 RepID=A0A0E9WGZ9_ANGAN